jgi:hypothetical protein
MRTSQTELKVRAARARHEALFANLGATPVEGNQYRFQLQTSVGILRLQSYGSWIACCFDEPRRALRVAGTRLNPFSGKWNWHWLAGAESSALSALQNEIRGLMPELAAA